MKKRFILLIDFSEYSNNLIKYAYDWSTQANAELLLVHQTIVLTPGLTDKEIKKSITEHTNNEAIQKLKSLAKGIIPPSAKVSYFASDNNLQLTLANLLKEPYDNIIFFLSKESKMLKKLFLGSLKVQIIDNIENIIVAIPKEITNFSNEKIFIAVTEKHPLNITGLKDFLYLINNTNTSLTFFYLTKPKENTEKIEKHLQYLSASFADRFNTSYSIYEASNPFEGINKIIKNKDSEILVVQKGSRLLTDHFFRKYLITELVYEGQFQLIILP